MGKQPNPSIDELCEYRRCGGKGGREVSRPRRARKRVAFGGRPMRVCESCADLLRRHRVGREDVSGVHASGPELVRDISRRIPLLTELPSVDPADRAPQRDAQRDAQRNGRSSKRERGPKSSRESRPARSAPHRERGDAVRPTPAPKRHNAPIVDAVVVTEPIGRRIRRRPRGKADLSVADVAARSAPVEGEVTPSSSRASESAGPEQRLYQLLKSRRCEFVDARLNGGNLWIVGSHELEPTIREARALGYAFRWSAKGGKKTKGRAGWWCKRMRA